MCMTNSKMSLSSEEVKAILHCFLDGRISLDDLLKLISRYITVEFPVMETDRRILRNELEGVIAIQVQSQYLSKMIKRYIDEQITEKELSDWAAFIFLSGIFIPKGETEEEQLEEGDGPVWDILQQLMTPSVFGGLNLQKASMYLDKLGDSWLVAQGS